MKFYPYKIKVLAMLKGGTTSFKVVLTQELEVLAIVVGWGKSFHPLKGGGGRKKFYPVSGIFLGLWDAGLAP